MSEPTEKEEWKALGAKLKYVREYLDLAQQVVASQTGIARSAVSDIERGARKVDSLELRKLARLYGYPVSYFLGDEAPSNAAIGALARAVDDLTPADREELIRFAQYLKYNARASKRSPS